MVKQDESKLTSQGQVSIPKKIREKLHLHMGDKVVFWEDEMGRVVIQEAETSIELSPAEWEVFLAKTKKEPVSRTTSAKAALAHLDKLMKK